MQCKGSVAREGGRAFLLAPPKAFTQMNFPPFEGMFSHLYGNIS